MPYGDFKDLTRRTTSDKILRDKHSILLRIQNTMDIKRVLLQWFVNFLIKKLQVEQLKMKVFLIKNYLKNYLNQLLENSGKEKYTPSFIDNIWGADLADMQLISKFNKGFRFLLCVIDIYSKYA